MTFQTAFAEKQPGQDEGAILGDNPSPQVVLILGCA